MLSASLKSTSTPLHRLCMSKKVTVPLLKLFIDGEPAAAVAADKAGSTPLHKLLETGKQRPPETQADLLKCYAELAPGAISVENLNGQLPAECMFEEVGLEARDFTPFILSDPNPLRPCLVIAARLIRKAGQQPRRRELLLASPRSSKTSRIGSSARCPTVRSPNRSSKTPSHGTRSTTRRTQAVPDAQDIAPPDDEQPPGPLALAVQYTDIDFCSAPCVRAFVEDFFTG